MGVTAAHFSTTRRKVERWRLAAALMFVVSIIAVVASSNATEANELYFGQYIFSDLIVGAAVALFFVAATDDEDRLWSPARILSFPMLATLGTFAYSIYLLHEPIILVTHEILRRAHADIAEQYVVYGSLVPVIIAISYGFYLVFERPFMSRFLRRVVEEPRGEVIRLIGDAG